MPRVCYAVRVLCACCARAVRVFVYTVGCPLGVDVGMVVPPCEPDCPSNAVGALEGHVCGEASRVRLKIGHRCRCCSNQAISPPHHAYVPA